MSIKTTTIRRQRRHGKLLKEIALKELSNKRLFVVDAFLRNE